jgi:osmotically-inducible protein OsmY
MIGLVLISVRLGKSGDRIVKLFARSEVAGDLVGASGLRMGPGGREPTDGGLVGEAIADADIAADCVAALDRDRFVPDSVNVGVTDGWITLSGEVRHHIERRAAEHAVRRVDGVLGVTDNIVLTSDPIPRDVTDRINRALRRNALIDDSLIEVTSMDHTIYLEGTVASWAAMDRAVDTAWEASGVGDVVNRLVIVP